MNGFKSDFDDFIELEKEVNSKARNILLATIDSTTHHQVSSCRTTKEIWDHFTIAHEGNSQVRDTQVDILVKKTELFTQKKGETIRELSGRFNALISALKNMSKDYSTQEKNRKFLNALSPEWKIKVVDIEEAKNLYTTPLVEIVGSLIRYEMNEARRNPPSEKKEKLVALRVDDTSSDDDEDIAMLSRKITQLIRSKRRIGNTSKVSFECKKPGHFKEDCPSLKKNMKIRIRKRKKMENFAM